VFDFNAKLGHWPYRPVKGLADLLKAMDHYGIERAAVSSLSAVHYLNPQDGNDELVKLIEPHRDRLIPFAVLRPNFTGWEDDLRRCFDKLGAKGVVVYPNYHGFELLDPKLLRLMAEASSRRFPVCVQTCLEDIRRQFRENKVQDVSPAVVGDFARAYPDVSIVALGLKFGQPQQMGEPLPANLFFDTSNYESTGEIEFAVEHFGPGKILFGTNYPLFNSLANINKLRFAAISAEARTMISQSNAERLFPNPPWNGGRGDVPSLR